MNPFQLLKKDHRKVKALLAELDETTERGKKIRKELFAEIKEELRVHEIIEEEIFYPALKESKKLEEIVLEGFQEHHVVDLILDEMAGLAVTHEDWGAKASVLKENIEHHIEEEEGEMFKKAEQAFSDEELNELGDRMLARKEKEMGVKKAA